MISTSLHKPRACYNTTLTFREKFAVIREVEEGLRKKCDIAKDYGISVNTVYNYLRNRDRILSCASSGFKNFSRKRRISYGQPDHPFLEECVLEWFWRARSARIPLSGALVRSKADEIGAELGISGFQASAGWLHCFIGRNNISFESAFGESADVDREGANIQEDGVFQTIEEAPEEYDVEEVVDACMGTSVGTITEPDCLGPCEPGTSVTLEGIVWHETEGVLVVNVTWRGKTYVGTLLDCSRHDTWAPPRFCDSPTSDLDARTPKGRGKRGRQATGAAAAADLSNFTETRSSVHSKLRSNNNGGAKGRRQPGGPGSPTPFAPPKPETPGKRKPGKVSPEEEAPAKKAKAAPPPPPPPAPVPPPAVVAPPAPPAPPVSPPPPPPSPVLLECPEPNCSKKYKHANGLKYHQSHAHGGEDDETKESASSLSEPEEAASPARKESAPDTPTEAPATPMEVVPVPEAAEPSPLPPTPIAPTPAPAPEEPQKAPSTPDKSVIKPSVLRFGSQEETMLAAPAPPPVSRPSQTAPLQPLLQPLQPCLQPLQPCLQPLQPSSPRQPSPAPALPPSLPPNLTPNVAPTLVPNLTPAHTPVGPSLAPGMAPNLSPILGGGLARELGPNAGPGPIQLVHQGPPMNVTAQVVQIAPQLVHQGPPINAKVPQFKVKPTSVLMPDEKKSAGAKPPSHKKKSRKSPAGSPHPHPHLVDPQPLGLESSGREDVQSPAYSDISDDGAPVLDPEVDGSKSKPVVCDKKEANPGQSPHSVQHYYSSYYGQPPYLVPSVTADKPKDSAVDKRPEEKPSLDKDKKEGPNAPAEFPQKMLQQHYYPYQYVPGYPYNIDTGYSVPLVEEKCAAVKEEKSPGPEGPKQPAPAALVPPPKVKTEPGAKEKHNDNHQILKESKDVISQMSPGYFYSRPQPPQPTSLQQHQQEEMRKYLIYENRRREHHQAATEPIGLKATPPPQHQHKPASAQAAIKKEKEDKKEEKKQEGVKPTMETQGPPPPPTSQYAYIHPGYMQSPHYGPIPFDPGHPVYARGINPMIVPGPYQQSPYMHPQLHAPMGRPYHAAEDLSRPQSGPKALDLLQHHASQYYTSHKIHELQERAMKSPTPAKATAATPSPGERAPGPAPGPQGPPPGPQGPAQAPAAAAAGKPPSGDGKDSRSPPPQRHVHTHHHTHVGLGYPILTGQYPAPFGSKPL